MGADHQRVARLYGHDGRGRGREELGDGFWDWLKMMTNRSTLHMVARGLDEVRGVALPSGSVWSGADSSPPAVPMKQRCGLREAHEPPSGP
jgi:hypothetical protein